MSRRQVKIFDNLTRIFPKRNSLLDKTGGRDELADMNEFAKKIQACKDT